MKKRRGKKCYPFVFRVRGLPRTNSIHFLKNGWRKDENLVDIFQRLRGIIYVLLSELCAKDSTTVEGITPSTLKISTESSVNSGARNQESGCKQRERERDISFYRGVSVQTESSINLLQVLRKGFRRIFIVRSCIQ